jgi:hypothetical protein
MGRDRVVVADDTAGHALADTILPTDRGRFNSVAEPLTSPTSHTDVLNRLRTARRGWFFSS